MTHRIRIASRASMMAKAQVDWLRGQLAVRDRSVVTEFLPVTTEGDAWAGSLSGIGGKGAFTRAVEQSLMDGRAELALHCLKDVPGDIPIAENTTLLFPARGDVRDALVHGGGLRLDDLPDGTRIGTSGPRRAAQLRRRYPRLTPVPVRGNADTRLGLVAAGTVDAVILSYEGLRRIGRADEATQILEMNQMLPAIGAGQLVMQVRAGDTNTLAAAGRLTDTSSTTAATAERILLENLAGHCHAPIAGYASVKEGIVNVTASVWSPDGSQVITTDASASSPQSAGWAAAHDLIGQGADALLSACRR
ncbi:hydroxymethylbilane synthase [Streptomyces sp. NPDC048255]|uniref:hydroxymethylbilane synthase n=1 Tax=Streptomyces sp. NPDC048255 TaxID=3154713 RepID=UPI0033FB375C